MKKYFIISLLGCFLSLGVWAQSVHQNNSSAWVYAGDIGVSIGNNSYGVQFSPRLGYKVLPNLELGITTNYSYLSYYDLKSSILGIGPSVNYYHETKLYFHTSFQRFFISQKYNNQKLSNIQEDALYVGAGYLQPISDRTYLQIGAIYNVFYDKNKSVFASGFVPSIGIVFGL